MGRVLLHARMVADRSARHAGGVSGNEAVVETTHGQIQGFRRDGVSAFLGVPYGSSTSGRRRFLPPQPLEPWAGARDATRLGPISPQLINGGRARPGAVQALFGGGDGSRAVQSEDCLRVNVWTPGADERRRPVMVWLHGGAFLYGMGTGVDAPAMTDGEALARFADAVVVTVNHRLGITGHFHLTEIFGSDYEGSGNAGLLDLAAALAWIGDNAAAFGGDSKRMLLFGQSGGGGKAHALMAMPSAERLFSAVALQSGLARTFHTPESASEVAGRLLADLAVGSPEELAALPLSRLLEAQAAALARDPTNVGLQPFYPVVDGTSMPRHPDDAVCSGWAATVPMVIGTVRDEVDLFLPVDESMDERALLEATAADTGSPAGHLVANYRAAHPDLSPADLRRRLETERLFRLPAMRLAERRADLGPVWVYEFHYGAPRTDASRGGAFHALEIPYIFQTVDAVKLTGTDPARFALARQVGTAWAGLAGAGDPNHPGLPPWPRYRAGEKATMIFDVPCRVELDPERSQLAAWSPAIGELG
jgi:para-nitrobenzyl esterase